MKKYVLFSLLALVVGLGSYYYGYNEGSKDERLFLKNQLVPLCGLLTLDKSDLMECVMVNL